MSSILNEVRITGYIGLHPEYKEPNIRKYNDFQKTSLD